MSLYHAYIVYNIHLPQTLHKSALPFDCASEMVPLKTVFERLSVEQLADVWYFSPFGVQ